MSDETKWTKGEWKVDPSRKDTVVIDLGPMSQATCYAGTKENAHLIAAAPELAEVARKLIEDYEAWQRDDISPHEIGDIVDEARDAYAKARGETS